MSTADRRWYPLHPYGPDGHDAPQFAYSLGVRRDDLVVVSGQISRGHTGRLVGLDDPTAQAVQVFENIRAVLRAAGGDLTDVIATTTHITDRAFREPVTAVRRRFFPAAPYPGNTLIVVAGLAIPEYLVEIYALATVGCQARWTVRWPIWSFRIACLRATWSSALRSGDTGARGVRPGPRWSTLHLSPVQLDGSASVACAKNHSVGCNRFLDREEVSTQRPSRHREAPPARARSTS